jgi:hypothetical protein
VPEKAPDGSQVAVFSAGATGSARQEEAVTSDITSERERIRKSVSVWSIKDLQILTRLHMVYYVRTDLGLPA